MHQNINNIKRLSLVILLLTIHSYSSSKTLRVPYQYPNIQSALNSAESGDTVLVYAGIYNESLIWPEIDSIVLTSDNDLENTILKSIPNKRSITFSDGLYTNATVISDLTFHGSQYHSDLVQGAAFYLTPNSSPVFDNLKLDYYYDIKPVDTLNSVYQGLVYMKDNCHPIIEDCYMRNIEIDNFNSVQGGVLYISDGSNPILNNFRTSTTKIENCNYLEGGVVYTNNNSYPKFNVVSLADLSSNNLKNCKGNFCYVDNNSSILFKEGYFSSSKLSNTVICQGGVVYLTGASNLIIDSIQIYGIHNLNGLLIEGGIMHIVDQSRIELTHFKIQSVVIEEFNQVLGGAIFIKNSNASLTLDNVVIKSLTVVNNVETVSGLYCYFHSTSPKLNKIKIESGEGKVTESIQGGVFYITDNSNPIIENMSVYDIKLEETVQTGKTSISGTGAFITHNSSPIFINGQLTDNKIIGLSNPLNGLVFNIENGSHPSFTNMTIVENEYLNGVEGSTFNVKSNSSVKILNSIIYNDNNNSDFEISSDNQKEDITFSNLRQIYDGEGNISELPVFDWDAHGCYFLREISPGYNLGKYEGAPINDIHGMNRTFENKPNPSMGALELIPINPLGEDFVYCDRGGFYSKINNEFGLFDWGEISYQITSREIDRVGEYASCKLIDKVNYNRISLPKVDLGEDLSLCEFPLILEAGISNRDYQWSTGDSLNTIMIYKSGKYNVTVTNSVGCISADTILIIPCENFIYDIKIYPNPASEILEINLQENLSLNSISIFNGLGKLVLEKKYNEEKNHFEINLSHINSGTYFLNILLNNGEVINESVVISK